MMEWPPRFVGERESNALPRLAPFRQAGRAFSVLDIAAPVGYVAQGTLLGDAFEEILVEGPTAGRSDRCVLVRKGPKTIGWISIDDLNGRDGEDVAPVRPIDVNATVPADTPLTEMLPLFESSDIYFLLTGHQVTHVVTFRDCDKLPFKMCLFGLLMELEAVMTEVLLLLADHDVNHLLEYLLPKRRTTVLKQFQRNYQGRRVQGHELLLCTTLNDKNTMILHDSEATKMLSDEVGDDIKCVLDRVKHLRDKIAHGESIFLVADTPVELCRIVSQVERLISVFSSAASR